MENPIKFSSRIDARVLDDLRQYAKETRQPMADLITDAVAEYLQRARIRPVFLAAAEAVLAEDRALLKTLTE